MIKEEIWRVPLQRAVAFFRGQEDVMEETTRVFRFRSCRIDLSELKPASMGIWAAKRVKVRMEGDEVDVEELHHRFLLQFLSM